MMTLHILWMLMLTETLQKEAHPTLAPRFGQEDTRESADVDTGSAVREVCRLLVLNPASDSVDF